MRRAHLVLALALILILNSVASATWSIVAVDAATGQVVVASATCLRQAVFPQIGAKDLRDIQAIVVPGKGAAVAQAAIDASRKNQSLIEDELRKGTAPSEILTLLKKADPSIERRQFGIVDLQGRSLGFTGQGNQANALDASGKVGSSIFYQIQGNILAADAVVLEAARALTAKRGGLAAQVMAAMEAADARGGDRRCTDGRTAYVAYILAVDKAGKETYLAVGDDDSSNPIKTLRERYDRTFGSSSTIPAR